MGTERKVEETIIKESIIVLEESISLYRQDILSLTDFKMNVLCAAMALNGIQQAEVEKFIASTDLNIIVEST